MKTTEEVILKEFGEDLSGYIYATPSHLADFYEKTWNEAIEAAAESCTTELTSTCIRVDKQSILKLKK